MLKGYRTYICSFAAIAVILLEGVFKVDVPGVVMGEHWLFFLFACLGTIFSRAAIENACKRITDHIDSFDAAQGKR